MRGSAIAASMVFLLLTACQQDQNVPTATDFANEREKLVQRVEKRKGKESKPVAGASKAVASTVGADGFRVSSRNLKYDPITMRDPFRSFEWDSRELEDEEGGPLEQFDLSQLDVMAVVWKTGSARALVQDPSGQSYIVGVGTRVGKNEGTVTEIEDSVVVVKERYVDYLGHETKKDVEMRIRRGQGG